MRKLFPVSSVKRLRRSSASQPPASIAANAPDSGALLRELDLPRLFNFRHPPGYYSEPDKVALLRRSRKEPYDQLLVDFSRHDVLIELTAAGRTLFSGFWNWTATAAGQSLRPAGPWTEQCWHTDADVDYLEICQPLSDGWKIERQMLLARKDNFLFLADAILGPASTSAAAPSDIRHRMTLPIADGRKYLAAAETCEGFLMNGRKRSATVVPLALPEWRAELAHASLTAEGNSLCLGQAARGRNLYAPLWLDLSASRFRQPLTWRKLTVAEELEIVPRDVAVGFRVEAAPDQWLIYRSLASRGNRTVLGKNFSSEFVCCRFYRNGETGDILEIQ